MTHLVLFHDFAAISHTTQQEKHIFFRLQLDVIVIFLYMYGNFTNAQSIP